METASASSEILLSLPKLYIKIKWEARKRSFFTISNLKSHYTAVLIPCRSWYSCLIQFHYIFLSEICFSLRISKLTMLPFIRLILTYFATLERGMVPHSPSPSHTFVVARTSSCEPSWTVGCNNKGWKDHEMFRTNLRSIGKIWLQPWMLFYLVQKSQAHKCDSKRCNLSQSNDSDTTYNSSYLVQGLHFCPDEINQKVDPRRGAGFLIVYYYFEDRHFSIVSFHHF